MLRRAHGTLPIRGSRTTRVLLFPVPTRNDCSLASPQEQSQLYIEVHGAEESEIRYLHHLNLAMCHDAMAATAKLLACSRFPVSSTRAIIDLDMRFLQFSEIGP